MATDLLFRNATVLTMDRGFTILENADVAIEGARITHVRPTSAAPAKRVIDATGKLVMPGLINCHTHAAMTLMRGLADDLALDAWWQTFIFPIEKKLVDAEFVSVGTGLAAIEMLRSGTTSFVDMYFFEDAAAGEVLIQDEGHAARRFLLFVHALVGWPRAPDASPSPRHGKALFALTTCIVSANI